jgi:hypothetical protein
MASFLVGVSHRHYQQRKQAGPSVTHRHNKLDSASRGHIMEKPHSTGEK